jgi:hypothetical protein
MHPENHALKRKDAEIWVLALPHDWVEEINKHTWSIIIPRHYHKQIAVIPPKKSDSRAKNHEKDRLCRHFSLSGIP